MLDKIGNPANRVIEVEGADHTTISIDLNFSSQVIRNGIDFFDTIVQGRKKSISNPS